MQIWRVTSDKMNERQMTSLSGRVAQPETGICAS